MDPTGTSGQGWKESVENMLTKHEENFGAITTSIQALNQSFSHLADLLNTRELELDQAQLPASPPVVNQESKVAPLEKYGGEPGDCAAFLMQCELQFEMQPSSFPSERAKVGYVLSLLVGRARTWGSAEWKRRTECCNSFESFSREMRRVFDPVKSEHETLNNLLSLSQGNRSVIDYIIEFSSLAADCSWNKSALYDAFYRGLCSRLKDTLATVDLPKNLDELLDLVIRLDRRYKERQQEKIHESRQTNRTSYHWNSPVLVRAKENTYSSNKSSDFPEPMQLGRGGLSKEERERRFKENLCLYCEGSGHRVNECPVKESAQQRKGGRC